MGNKCHGYLLHKKVLVGLVNSPEPFVSIWSDLFCKFYHMLFDNIDYSLHNLV